MPRNISFALTTEQFQNHTKDVTRRAGWRFLKPGDKLCGVRKCMGLKKGEKIERFGLLEVVSARVEPLNAITQNDVVREGFPDWTPAEFVAFFTEKNNCPPDVPVNRIEFRYIDG